MLLYGFHKFIQYYCELYASVVKFKILNLKIFFAEWTTLYHIPKWMTAYERNAYPVFKQDRHFLYTVIRVASGTMYSQNQYT